jgi:hypothetical protein
VFGADRRVVLTHSANLHTKQAAGFDQTLAKTTRDLGELAATLARGKTRRRLDAVQAALLTLNSPSSLPCLQVPRRSQGLVGGDRVRPILNKSSSRHTPTNMGTGNGPSARDRRPGTGRSHGPCSCES